MKIDWRALSRNRLAQALTVALAVVLTVGWLWQRGSSALAEADRLRAMVSAGATLQGLRDDIAKLESDIAKRKADYDIKVGELTKVDAKLRARRAELDKLTREAALAEVSSMTANELSEEFKAMGYDNTVVKEVQR